MIPRWLAPAATPVTSHGVLSALRVLGAQALGAKRTTVATHDALVAALCSRFGAERACLTDSGTSALRLGIAALCPEGRAVALPAFGCYDLITALQGAGRRTILYDIDPATLAPQLESVDAALARDVGAFVVASTFGYAPPMDALLARVRARGVPLIEDIAQGGGARWDGRLLGSWGDAAVLSFGRGKGLGGAGGGALVLHASASHAVVPAAMPATPLGRDAKGVVALLVQQVLSHPRLFALPSAIPQLGLGETRYHAPHVPNAPGTAQSAVALDALRHVDGDRESRSIRGKRVMDALFHLADIVTPITVEAAAEPGWLRVGALMSPIVAAPLRPLGVRPSYPIALPDHPELQPLRDDGASMPGAHILSERLVSLPCHGHVRDSDIMQLARLLSVNPHQ